MEVSQNPHVLSDHMMQRIFQYCSLAVQGCLVALFFGVVLHGQIYVAFELQRHTIKSVEEKQPLPLSILYAFLLELVNHMSFVITPSIFRIFGIKSENTILIFPIVHSVASAVGWCTGYLPVFILIPIYNISFSILLIRNERKRRSTPYPPSAATGKQKSQPKSKIPRAYLYKRLTRQRSIRILTLAPSRTFDAPLECRLFEVRLDNAPRYTALSYAWDASEKKTSIFCNRSFLKITRNCAKALHRIRQMQGSSSINLWVDSICIDQGSTRKVLSERTQQIQIMGEIYKRASRVIAWVGEHKYDSRYVCEFLESVGRAFDEELDDASAWKRAEELALENTRQWIVFTDRLLHFFQRSWFTRMWPVQEVTLPLPGRVSLLCGNSSIPFEYIRAGWQVLPKIGLLPSSVNLDQSVALQFYLADALALKRKYSSTTNTRRLGQPLITDLSQLSLSSIMRATRFKACSLAKDKFFALLGVFKELEVPHKVDVSRYSEMTEVEVFLAVFESCVALDSSLDVLRLTQSPEGYVSHDDFWAKRQNPYDSLANAVLGTVAKISPILIRGVVDNVPEWRASLPSWVPDWTQWTHSDIDDRDIALIRSYSTRSLWGRPLWSAANSTKLVSPRGNDLQDACPVTIILYRRLPTADGARESLVPWSVNDRPRIRVRAKVVGVVKSVGSVDSVGLLWQLISALFHFYTWQSLWVTYRTRGHEPVPEDPFLQPVPDAFMAATIETVRNFVIHSNITQALLSLRMLCQAFDVMAFLRFFHAVYHTWLLQPVLERAICSIFPSAAACLGSGLEFDEPSWITIVFSTALCLFDPVDDPSNRFAPLYRHFQRQISIFIVCGAWLVWHFRVSLYNTTYSYSYEELPSWFIEGFSIYLVAIGVFLVAGYFEDEVLILLSQAAIAIGGLHMTVSLLLFSPLIHLTMLMLIATGRHFCRCIRGCMAEILGSEMFTRRPSFTSGLNFFTTESGLTGSTSGPVQLFDVIIIVHQASDPMAMRRCGEEFEVVGVAFVGNKSRKELEESSDPGSWNIIYIL